MLVRVALHQTRLRTPGLGLDAKGVALGAKGLVLLPSLDRLVAFLALYSRSSSLEDILRSLKVEVVKSKLGAREVTLTFATESSDRMDRVAEVARLAGGYTFTGTSRHFVQYRDAAAPFGYDAGELLAQDGALFLYHSAFTQAYSVERAVELRALLLRLRPQLDPKSAPTRTVTGGAPGAEGAHAPSGPIWIAAERGLGPALIAYFIRSGVDADVGLAEWPPASSFDDAPVQRYIFRVGDLPARMLPLVGETPGLSVFHPVADGVGVELGYKHPVNLRACPVFDREGLVLFRGKEDPLELATLPALGPVSAFARVELRAEENASEIRAVRAGAPNGVALALRMVPTTDPWRGVTATWVPPEELPLLRRIAYVLGPETLRRATVAFTSAGAFVRYAAGIESVPVGEFYREVHPRLYVPAGYDPLPAVSPEVLHKSLGAPAGQVLFIGRDAAVVGVAEGAFVSLETALLEAQTWAPLPASAIEPALVTRVPELSLESPGLLPLRDLGVKLPEDA